MAETSVYTHTFSTTDKTFTADGAATLSDVSWTLATTWVTENKDYNRDTNSPSQGMKIGSNNKAIQTMKLSTSGITGVIDSIYFETNARSGAVVAMSVTVDGTAYEGPASFTGTGAYATRSTLTYKGSKSGEIVLSWDETEALESKKGAFYLTVLKVYSHENAPAPEEWDGTVTLSKTTFKSIADLEGLQLTFNGATTVTFLGEEEAGGVIFQNENGSDIYAAWGPAYGGTCAISGNVVTLNGWDTDQELTSPLPATSGSVYFEDYGNFIVDGDEEAYFETAEATYEAPAATTYTVTYSVTGAVAEEAAVLAAGYYDGENEGVNFVAGANVVPEHMFAYVYVSMIEGYTCEVKVNDAAVTLNDGYWEGAINADMTIAVAFKKEGGEENEWASTYTSNVTFTAGTNSYLTDTIIINSVKYGAYKIGTSKNTGNCKITLPAGTEHLYIHATGWSKSETTTMTIKGAGLDKTETLAYYLNISNTSPYTVAAEYDATKTFFAYDFETPLTAAAEVTLSGNARVVFFGVNVDGNITPTALQNTTAVKAVKVIENGNVVIIREGVRYNIMGARF